MAWSDPSIALFGLLVQDVKETTISPEDLAGCGQLQPYIDCYPVALLSIQNLTKPWAIFTWTLFGYAILVTHVLHLMQP